MPLIIQKTFERTLDQLLARYGKEGWRGAQLEAWVFEDASARHDAEYAFAKAGITARLYSAYKPLVHFFLEEEVARGSFKRVTVTYPVDPTASERRFLLESYPLAAMVDAEEIRFLAATPRNRHEYEVELIATDDTTVHHTVFAPNQCARDHIGETVLSPCGWLRVSHSDGRLIDTPLQTDYECLFHEAMETIGAYPWGDAEPFFEAMHIEISLPGKETYLGVGEEAIRLQEALHEDLYFSVIELFQKKTGRASGARDLQPGQIIPEIKAKEGPISLRIETRALSGDDAAWAPQLLHEANGPFSTAQIGEILASIGGESFGVTSRTGRTVPACYVRGSDLPIMISGGQHSNETSGVVGALRGASLLAKRSGAHFAVSPLENPDGYAVHWRLCQEHPQHLHHAARYTALGDDLEYRQAEPLYEKGIRRESYKRTQALLHINLHGYPSHEWTRPLTGYIPRGFEMWTLPKGFLLLVRHHTGWQQRSRVLLEKVSTKLCEVPGLVSFNERQIRLCEIHAGPLPLEIINGFPCLISETERHTTPMTLITEHPDETIYGDAFRLAHEAHTQTVVAAYEALQEIMADVKAG